MNRIALSLAIPSLALTLTAVLAGGGCAGELENPALFGPTTCSAPTIFAASCATASCHSAAAKASNGNLDLGSPGVEARLVGQPGSATCSGLLVDPANPDESLILTKLSSSPTCGAPMPFGQSQLPAPQIACIREWIVGLGSGSGGGGGSSSSSAGSGSGGEPGTGGDGN